MSLNAKLCFNRRATLPMILQNERADCGHACLAMISQFWGHELDLFSILRLSNTSSRGVTLLEIHQLADRLGFLTRALQVPLEELNVVKCPAILHWNMNHFVVLKQVKKNKIVIHDPAAGVRECCMEEVNHSFTGVVLEIEKSNHFETIRQEKKLTLFALVKTMRGVNTFLVLLLMLSLSIEILSLLNPLFMQYVTDNVVGFSDKNNLYMIAIGFLILVLMQVFTEYIRGNMVVYFTSHLTEQFSSNVMKHLLKLPLAFFEKRHKGDLQSKFLAIDHVQKKISTDFVNTVLDGFMILLTFAVMAIYSPLLTVVVSVALFTCFGLRYASYQHLKQQSDTSLQQHAKTMSLFLETLQGIVPIKSFLKERVRFTTWRNSYIDSLNADIVVSKMNVFYQVAHQGVFHIEHIIVVVIGASLVLDNRFSLGMLMAFLAYRGLLVTKASSFIQHLFDYKLIALQLNRLSDILFQEPEDVRSGCSQVGVILGGLTLENIFFTYHPGAPFILQNISLSIKAGEKVAIVGPSGSGKSTLLKVMMGLLEKTSGQIYIDAIPLNKFGLKEYRHLTAAVMQEDTLLTGSIMDNICFFDEQMDLEHMYAVATQACIHETISELPMGYETLVGDMGSSLSGGQKQRILLARALYKRPKILFLDEATSHLDVENERRINEALKALEITQIIIAHRKETIQMADRVIELVGVNSIVNAYESAL